MKRRWEEVAGKRRSKINQPIQIEHQRERSRSSPSQPHLYAAFILPSKWHSSFPFLLGTKVPNDPLWTRWVQPGNGPNDFAFMEQLALRLKPVPFKRVILFVSPLAMMSCGTNEITILQPCGIVGHCNTVLRVTAPPQKGAFHGTSAPGRFVQ
jgi:hypothetical protein